MPGYRINGEPKPKGRTQKMNDPANNKGPGPGGFSSYRRRQERYERLLPFFWIGVMLLIVGVGYVAYLLSRPDAPLQALDLTGTPTQAGIAALGPTDIGATAGSTTAPTAAGLPEQSVTPAPTGTPTVPAVITYVVQEGDNLFSISEQFNAPLPTLYVLNPSLTPDLLSIGDELRVPGQGAVPAATSAPAAPGLTSFVEYEVAAGDTLAGIAAQFGTTIDAIVQQNSLPSADQIREGQILIIPVAGDLGTPGTPTQTGTSPAVTITPLP
jgi:LysM repeat protein